MAPTTSRSSCAKAWALGNPQRDAAALGRLILEDLPERNLLLEAYKTPN